MKSTLVGPSAEDARVGLPVQPTFALTFQLSISLVTTYDIPFLTFASPLTVMSTFDKTRSIVQSAHLEGFTYPQHICGLALRVQCLVCFCDFG